MSVDEFAFLANGKVNLSYTTGQRLLRSFQNFLPSPGANQSFRAWYLCGTSIRVDIEQVLQRWSVWYFNDICSRAIYFLSFASGLDASSVYFDFGNLH